MLTSEITQADIAHRKKEVAKQTAAIKARQKEVQTAELEIGKSTFAAGRRNAGY